MRLNWAPSLALIVLACAPAHSAFLGSASATFTGGVFGAYQITFTSDQPGLQLYGVEFNLLTGIGGGPGLNLFLDPSGAAPGYLLNQALTSISGASETGFVGDGNVHNGSTAFSVGFSDFTSGEIYSFRLDVDHHVMLRVCPSSPAWAVVACNVANGLSIANGSVVNGTEFAGTGVTFHFGLASRGLAYSTQFAQAGEFSDDAFILFDTPEPGSWATMASGLGLLFWFWRNRPRTAIRQHLSRLR